MRLAALLAALAVLSPLPAVAREIAGVKVTDTSFVDGQELRLNGAGLRKRAWIEVYVGALYLVEPSKDAAAIIESDQPKRVRMVFLRNVDRKSIMEAFEDGFDKNSPSEAAEMKKLLPQIAPAVGDLKKGQDLVVTYVPGKGTTVAGPGGVATVPGKPFADALFRNWLGKNPPSKDLRDGMLGR